MVRYYLESWLGEMTDGEITGLGYCTWWRTDKGLTDLHVYIYTTTNYTERLNVHLM